ncbi:hypothetical protein Dimus_027100 [Dionaea muscipula]
MHQTCGMKKSLEYSTGSPRLFYKHGPTGLFINLQTLQSSRGASNEANVRNLLVLLTYEWNAAGHSLNYEDRLGRAIVSLMEEQLHGDWQVWIKQHGRRGEHEFTLLSPTGHGEVFILQTLRKKKTMGTLPDVGTLPGAAVSANSFTYRHWIMHGRAVTSSLGTTMMKLLQMRADSVVGPPCFHGEQ